MAVLTFDPETGYWYGEPIQPSVAKLVFEFEDPETQAGWPTAEQIEQMVGRD